MLPKNILLSSLFLLLLSQHALGQEFDWWNEKHNWDGITPWHEYLTISPAFLGPNALPVPEIQTGEIAQNDYFSIGLEGHFSSGDKTQNLTTDLFTRLFSERVALRIQLVPIEHYALDEETRDLRKARNYDANGYAGGDFYVGTYIQFIKDHDKLPDLLLTVNLKTASGTHLNDARFTDAPGYFFDLSTGKTFTFANSKISSIRPFVMLGFYAWQTYDPRYLQNDAVSFGTGIEIESRSLIWNSSIGGYSGYIGNGDRPIVVRLQCQSNYNSKLNFALRFQQGLHDYMYSSFSGNLIFNLGTIFTDTD